MGFGKLKYWSGSDLEVNKQMKFVLAKKRTEEDTIPLWRLIGFALCTLSILSFTEAASSAYLAVLCGLSVPSLAAYRYHREKTDKNQSFLFFALGAEYALMFSAAGMDLMLREYALLPMLLLTIALNAAAVVFWILLYRHRIESDYYTNPHEIRKFLYGLPSIILLFFIIRVADLLPIDGDAVMGIFLIIVSMQVCSRIGHLMSYVLYDKVKDTLWIDSFYTGNVGILPMGCAAPVQNEAYQEPNSGEDQSSDTHNDYYEFLKWMAMIELNTMGNDVVKRYREHMEKADGKERAFGQF